jgi:uncharacterized protein (TIGR03086 family)
MSIPASDEMFLAGLDTFDGVVRQVEDWAAPSACAGWSALDVLGHLGTAIQMGVDILEGKEMSWSPVAQPGVLVEGDPVEFWSRTAERARAAMVGVDLDAEINSPMGRRTVAEGLAFPAIDLFLHAWDIAAPAGLAVELPDELIEFSHAHIDPYPVEVVRGGNIFGPAVDPPPDATPIETFLAWTGRDPRVSG